MEKIIVNLNSQSEVRLDIFLSNHFQSSRQKAIDLIKDGQVQVNDKTITKTGFILKSNDVILINEAEQVNEINCELFPSDQPLNIVYEDNYLMVINKPSGVLTHPTSFNETDTIANRLVNYLKDFKDTNRPGIVHRLDKDTSGVLLIAKNLEILKILQEDIAKKKIKRKYYALVHNHFNEKHLLIKAPIIRCADKTTKMVVSDRSDAKYAETEIFVKQNLKEELALIECILHTGRTHQIRVHLKYIHHPIFNDDLYYQTEGYPEYGQFLHAYHLSFVHPITNKYMKFEIEFDKTFSDKLKEVGYE